MKNSSFTGGASSSQSVLVVTYFHNVSCEAIYSTQLWNWDQTFGIMLVLHLLYKISSSSSRPSMESNEHNFVKILPGPTDLSSCSLNGVLESDLLIPDRRSSKWICWCSLRTILQFTSVFSPTFL